MPGIFGLIRKTNSNIEENGRIAKAMTERLLYNDNFEKEIIVGEKSVIGNIGLPPVTGANFYHHPESPSAFSGFIYQMDQSNQQDNQAAALVEIYKNHGRSFIDKIEFSASIFIGDTINDEYFLATDHFGNRQLFIYENDQLLIFASELKAFYDLEFISKELDDETVADYFNFGTLFGNRTWLKDVWQLDGGHYLTIKNGQVTKTKYWDYYYEENPDYAISDLIDELDAVYPTLLKERIDGYNDIILPLSGGLDSRFIAGHLGRLNVKANIYSHGKSGCDDHRLAKQVSKASRLDDFGFIEIDPIWMINHFEEHTFLNDGALSAHRAALVGINYAYPHEAATTSFLNGIFGGPSNFGSIFIKPEEMSKEIDYESKMKRIIKSLQAACIVPHEMYEEMFDKDFYHSVKEKLKKRVDEELTNCLEVSDYFCYQKDVFMMRNLGRQQNFLDMNRYFWHDHFAISDRRLYDIYSRLPMKAHTSRYFLKEYFKTKFPELAKIPYQSTGVDLYSEPSAMRKNIKYYRRLFNYKMERLTGGWYKYYSRHDYIHRNQWYRSHQEIRQYFEDLLLDEHTIRRGYFNKEGLLKTMKRQNAGGDGLTDIGLLATFELFNQMVIDR